MYFDRFDICQAYYVFFVSHHEGQGSKKYARLSRLTEYFSPGIGFRDYADLTENGQAIYKQLCTGWDSCDFCYCA